MNGAKSEECALESRKSQILTSMDLAKKSMFAFYPLNLCGLDMRLLFANFSIILCRHCWTEIWNEIGNPSGRPTASETWTCSRSSTCSSSETLSATSTCSETSATLTGICRANRSGLCPRRVALP